MRHLLITILFLGLNLLTLSSLEADSSQANGCSENGEEAGAYDEYVEHPRCRKNILRGYYLDEQDPTEELEQDTSWPSRNEEFSDQLFTPNGGPW